MSQDWLCYAQYLQKRTLSTPLPLSAYQLSVGFPWKESPRRLVPRVYIAKLPLLTVTRNLSLQQDYIIAIP